MRAPFPIQTPQIISHIDGFRLTYMDGTVDDFPDWEGVSAAFYTATAALALLTDVFKAVRA
jgi:hypothetical protein